ncbi:MAG TPA: phenylalanine--tRNA ligase subunit beta [Terriglobales bacterium]|nr:phenylalanine--tRNA ligase subunit beta [Terriglobales bacterium]
MLLLPSWLREFVNIPVDDTKLADDLTMAGISIEGVTSENGQTVYDIDITPNRVDAMNHYGVARDCAAVYNADLISATAQLPDGKGKANFTIEIADADLCARYTSRIVRGVTIKPSPQKVADRLTLLGSRPINNVADATNYALQEFGHPTHAFDLDKLEGKIIVRRAHDGEVVKTLDGVERKLTKDDLVIADAKKAVAIAGVMGGFDTMITEETKNVLIEAAWFDPAAIRRTSRRLGMHTDASHRFERGADWGCTPLACDRVAQLILESAGGTLEGGQIDVVARKVERPTLSLRRSEVTRILGRNSDGQEIDATEIERILRHLGFGVTAGRSTVVSKTSGATAGSGGTHAAVAEAPADFTVQVPTWRLDVEREIDLIEEVARIYGFERFPNTLPTFSGAVQELPDERKETRMRRDLLAMGYDQAISLSFISHEEAKAFASMDIVEVANPLSEEASVMRTSLVPSMLDMLARNLNYGTTDVRVFEFGNAYEKLGEKAEQYRRLAMGATGNAVPGDVHEKSRPYTFFDMKGDIETMLSAFQYSNIYFDATAAEYFHPGRSARVVIDGRRIGQFGQIHPKVAAERKLKQDIFVAEFDLERLYQQSLRDISYRKLSNFPAVDRDFSFIFDDAVTFEKISNAVDALRLSDLTRFWPVEVFRGGSVPAGKYSVLLRAEFQSNDRTLRDEEVALWAAQIVTALNALGGAQRA